MTRKLGGYKTEGRGGGACEVLPLEKKKGRGGGGRTSFSHAERGGGVTMQFMNLSDINDEHVMSRLSPSGRRFYH